MKAIIVSDFAVLRSALLQLLGICLVIALFMGYVMGAVDTAAAIAAMIPFTGLFSLAAYDEQNNWERFRLTLPLTRRQALREARVLASEARGAFRAQKSAIVRVLAPFFGASCREKCDRGGANVFPDGLGGHSNELAASLSTRKSLVSMSRVAIVV